MAKKRVQHFEGEGFAPEPAQIPAHVQDAVDEYVTAFKGFGKAKNKLEIAKNKALEEMDKAGITSVPVIVEDKQKNLVLSEKPQLKFEKLGKSDDSAEDE